MNTSALFLIAFACLIDQAGPVTKHERAISAQQDAGAALLLTDGESRVLSADDELSASWFSRLSGTPSTYVPLIRLNAKSITPDAVRRIVPSLTNLIAIEGQNIAGETFIVVDVSGSPTITSELVSELRNALPNCRITGDLDAAADNPDTSQTPYHAR